MAKTKREVYVKRLREWARLVAQPSKRLDMESYFCGTACCAAGWAAKHKLFNRDGLGVARVISGDCFPVYAGHDGYSALGLFFGIHWNAVDHICSPEEYPGAKIGTRLTGAKLRAEVVRRIRAAIKEVGRA